MIRMNQPKDRLMAGIAKGSERYVIVFDADDADQASEALRTLGRWASDPELSFTWYDASALSMRIRKLAGVV